MKKIETSTQWLEKLIAYNTTSSESNLTLIHDVQAYLEPLGFVVRLTYDETKNKANLLATLPDVHGGLTGGLVLSGHTDVVPVEGQAWESDPFTATIKEGRLYGRGSCDMKGFIACVLAQAPTWSQQAVTKPLHIALSYDEEVGCLGAPHLIHDMQANGIMPSVCVVGEPTNMQPVIGHKGIHVFRCTVKGKAAHSSLTLQGCNAIEYAARLICYLRQFADFMRYQGDQDPSFDVPFTTISTNQISGGMANNIIPDQCEFFFEFRHLAIVNPEDMQAEIKQFIKQELLPRLQGECPQADITLEQVAAVPGMDADLEQDFVKTLQRITQTQSARKVGYATEAGQFQKAGMTTVVCGPGSVEQAHRANEYVSLDQLNQCDQFLQTLIQDYVGTQS